MLISENSAIALPLRGALLLKPRTFRDGRGVFHKLYTSSLLKSSGVVFSIAEDYLTYSKKGALRGLHYQIGPFAQAKLVTCLAGEIFDVIVDMRERSPTFGKWHSEILSGDNQHTIYVPRGFAHGCLALRDGTVMTYKADNPYDAEHEAGLLWSDTSLSIPWPDVGLKIVSEKDNGLPLLGQAKRFP